MKNHSRNSSKVTPLVRTTGKEPRAGLEKAATGIQGLDEVTLGGLPRGRPTLICGSAGCGKTLLEMEFLVRGAVKYDEPGVFMTFEETEEAIWGKGRLSKSVCL